MPDAVTVKVPATLSPKTAKHLPRLSQTVCKILDLRDLVRLDYRLTSEGQLYFIEANALPSLEPGATTVHASAALAGLVPPWRLVLDAVIKSAVERYGILVVRAFPKPAKGPEGWSSHSISSASSPWMQMMMTERRNLTAGPRSIPSPAPFHPTAMRWWKLKRRRSCRPSSVPCLWILSLTLPKAFMAGTGSPKCRPYWNFSEYSIRRI